MQYAVIVDLDGTLSDDSHRRGWVTGRPRNFEKYYSLIPYDPIKEEILKVILMQKKCDHHVLLLTGRPEHYRKETEEWLKKHHVPYDALFMRPNQDFTKSAEFKRRIFQEAIKGKFKISIALDDDKTVIDMWNQMGVEALLIV